MVAVSSLSSPSILIVAFFFEFSPQINFPSVKFPVSVVHLGISVFYIGGFPHISGDICLCPYGDKKLIGSSGYVSRYFPERISLDHLLEIFNISIFRFFFLDWSNYFLSRG